MIHSFTEKLLPREFPSTTLDNISGGFRYAASKHRPDGGNHHRGIDKYAIPPALRVRKNLPHKLVRAWPACLS